MNDGSVLARRLEQGNVQFGWCGYSNCYKEAGRRLLLWYNTPELVDYLFGLGELGQIGKPYSENDLYTGFDSHFLLGVPYSLGKTEREIFNSRFSYDNGYFYDLDQCWYYIIAGPFQIKIPLELVANNLDESGYEFNFLRDTIELQLMDFILGEYRESDACFKAMCDDCLRDEIKMRVRGQRFPIIFFSKNYRKMYSYFDDWVVVIADESNTKVERFKICPREINVDKHKETIEW